MKKKLLALSISLVLTATSGILHAEGNISAGKQKASACAGCHGETGNSMVSTFPKLAEQHASYLINQLQSIKDGSRNSPMMKPMTLTLSKQDMADIAAFYASQSISGNQLPVVEEDDDDDDEPAEDYQALVAEGEKIYRNGDLHEQISACTACHSERGIGNKPAGFPALRSQHADYLIQTLNDFKEGNRTKNPDNMMHMIAKRMSAKEIKAVAYYLSVQK